MQDSLTSPGMFSVATKGEHCLVGVTNHVLPWQSPTLCCGIWYWERKLRTLAQVSVKSIYQNLTKDLKHAFVEV